MLMEGRFREGSMPLSTSKDAPRECGSSAYVHVLLSLASCADEAYLSWQQQRLHASLSFRLGYDTGTEH
jgi:hypothetical protein